MLDFLKEKRIINKYLLQLKNKEEYILEFYHAIPKDVYETFKIEREDVGSITFGNSFYSETFKRNGVTYNLEGNSFEGTISIELSMSNFFPKEYWQKGE